MCVRVSGWNSTVGSLAKEWKQALSSIGIPWRVRIGLDCTVRNSVTDLYCPSLCGDNRLLGQGANVAMSGWMRCNASSDVEPLQTHAV